jgi:hypothetical protein
MDATWIRPGAPFFQRKGTDMTWFEILWLWPVWVALIICIGFPLLWVLEWVAADFDPVQRDYNRFSNDCHQRGLSPKEMFAELDARMALAKLRRIASDAVVIDPDNWRRHIDEAVQTVLGDLAATKPQLLGVVGATIRDMSRSDILYPDAIAAIDRNTLPITIRRRYDADFSAALRTLR